MLIEYKHKTLKTDHNQEISDQLFNDLRLEYYKKPDYETVKVDFEKIANGYLLNKNITNYYFKDLMAKVILNQRKFSIEDVFDYKPLLSYFIAKVYKNKKIYNKDNLLSNIETAFRLGGKGVASKPTNFPLKKANEILKKYNVNNNYYDFSCGWGVRLTSALVNNINYYGTDPNYILVERLNQLTNDYKKEITNCNSLVEIKSQGSEVFIPELENKIGLAFSSPPYYNLENYIIGNQSYKDGVTYEQWLDNYLRPTIKNIYRYLIRDGILAINVKSFDKYDLLKDIKQIILNNGFIFKENHNLENIKRTKSTGDMLLDDEIIMVFTKETL